jgi:hypothetical protein
MNGFVSAVAISIIVCGVQNSALAKQPFADDCSQGYCSRLYLLSTKKISGGRIAARVRTEFYNNNDTPADPPRYDTWMVSCSLKGGYVRDPDGNQTAEPEPADSRGQHATYEQDSLWSAVCGYKF